MQPLKIKIMNNFLRNRLYQKSGWNHGSSLSSAFRSKSCKPKITFVNFSTIFLLYLLILPASVNSEVYRIPLYKSEGVVNSAVLLTKRSLSSQGVTVGDRNLGGKAGQGYYARVDIGDPPQTVNALIDTGSSNFAVAASPHPDISHYYNMSLSRTLKRLGTEVQVPYTEGEWKGELGREVVRLYVTSPSLSNSSFLSEVAFITKSTGFFINGSRWQAILGLGYREIIRPDSTVEPMFDALIRQTSVNNLFSLQLCGTTGSASSEVYGSMTVGNIDQSLYTGPMYYVPVRKEWYYEVIITDIQVNNQSLGLDCKEYNFDKTIVDSGTTNLRLPSRVFNALITQLQNSVKISDRAVPEEFWRGAKLICWPRASVPWKSLPYIKISLATGPNTTLPLSMSPRQYLQYIPDEIGLTPGQDCYRFSVSQSDYGTVLGAVFMEGFYVVFDRANKRVGFAVTSCPWRDDGSPPAIIQPPQLYLGDTQDCGYTRDSHSSTVLNVSMYVIASLCAICLVAFVLLLARWILAHRVIARRSNDIDDLLTETAR